MEIEGVEQEILLQPEAAVIGAVYSVNGKTGNVVLTTSDLENDSDYQTGAQVQEAIAGKQDTLTAGDNIQISAENVISATDTTYTAGTNVQISNENVISATDTTYSAGNGLNLNSGNEFSINTTVVATQQNLATEVQNRENADNALQAQIDGISASSDVVDIVGTYADLQNYDTSKLKDNDIIKVLQDSTQNNATTYYRWSTHTNTFTLIGQEGPYYTKSAADAQFVPQTRTVNSKALSTNITLTASDVNALGTSDVVQTTGTSTSQVMSQNATTQALNTKLNITDYVVDDELKNSTNPVQNGVLYDLFGTMPTDFFTGNATTNQTGTSISFNNPVGISNIELQGDTSQQTYTGKNLFKLPDSLTKNNVTFTNNGDGTFDISTNGTASANSVFAISLSGALPSGNYTLSRSDNASNVTMIVQDYNGPTWVSNMITLVNGTSITENITPTANTTSFALSVLNGSSVNIQNATVQLESGTTASSWEPYVGSMPTQITPSPNPDYPQDVQVVTGEQTVNVYGKNLFPVTNQDFTVNNVHFYTQNGTLYADGNSTGETYSSNVNWKNNFAFTLSAGTYTVSLDTTFTACTIRKMSDDTTLVTINGGTLKNATFTLTEETELYLGIYMYQLSLTDLRVPFQLEAGSDVSTYEPYQGATYNVDLMSKNLFDKDAAKSSQYLDAVGGWTTDTADSYINQEYTLNGGETIYFSFTSKAGIPYVRLGQWNSSGTFLGRTLIDTEGAVILNAQTTKVVFSTTAKTTDYFTDLQIEKNTVATAYTPYYSYELCKFGNNYQDYIYKSGSDWYVHKMVEKATLTGSNTLSVNADSTNTTRVIASSALPTAGAYTLTFVCDHFIPKSMWAIDETGMYLDQRNVVFRADKTIIGTTQQTVTTWLNSNSVNIYYAQATATDIQITDSTLISQLNALLDASVYAKTTYISNTATSPNLPAILDVDSFNGNYQGIAAKLRES